MSRSRWKSHTRFGRFDNFVCYFSNKKSRTEANQTFRTKNKAELKRIKQLIYAKNFDDIFDDKFLYNIREASNVWDFSSDGLKHYIRRNWHRCTHDDELENDEEWERYARK